MSFDFRGELEGSLEKLGIDLEAEAASALETYFTQLKKWKSKVNLIAKSAGDAEIVEKHFVDCLTLLPYLREDRAHLLDIGTGGGFPGLICKAVLPELKLTLVEPRLKRVSFLRHLVRTLGLSDVVIYAKRLEEVPQLCESEFTHITCRAVTEIGAFLDMVGGFSGTGARLVLMKGPKWREELNHCAESPGRSPFIYKNVVEYVLPRSGAQRALLFFVTV